MSDRISHIELCNFCNAWFNENINKVALQKEFVAKGWQYKEFKEIATKARLFVWSMEVLKYGESILTDIILSVNDRYSFFVFPDKPKEKAIIITDDGRQFELTCKEVK